MTQDGASARTTLKDIAQRTNVSIKTVSNVVRRNDGRVGAATRERILAAIAELDYRPNLAARQLRRGRVGVIALAIPAVDNPYFAAIARLTVEHAASRGYVVLIDHTDGDRENELTIARGLRRDLIDGIIFNPLMLDEGDIDGSNPGLPVVLLGERLVDAEVDHVLIDNRVAARVATEHLLGLGRRRIAAIGVIARPPAATARLRLEGYAEALAAAGRPVDPDLVIPAEIRSFSREDGAAVMRTLLARADPPDAVFCFNDMIALGAMRAALDAGLRIPQDIALVGIDDIEDGRYATPSLTTVAPDKRALAHLAVDLLIGRIEGTRGEPPRLHLVPFELIVRESTAGRPGLAAATPETSQGGGPQ